MNINVVNRSWRAFSNRLTKLIGAKVTAPSRAPSQILIRKELEKYSSWPTMSSPSFLESDENHVDVHMLEFCVANVLPKKLSNNFLASSKLDGSSLPWHSPQDIKRIVALRNLSDLLRSTIHEMKQIEYQHIARSRG